MDERLTFGAIHILLDNDSPADANPGIGSRVFFNRLWSAFKTPKATLAKGFRSPITWNAPLPIQIVGKKAQG